LSSPSSDYGSYKLIPEELLTASSLLKKTSHGIGESGLSSSDLLVNCCWVVISIREAFFYFKLWVLPLSRTTLRFGLVSLVVRGRPFTFWLQAFCFRTEHVVLGGKAFFGHLALLVAVGTFYVELAVWALAIGPFSSDLQL